MTHPFSPLRVKALKLFDDSVLTRKNGTSTDDLEVGVQGLMSLMEPSYLEGRTDIAETMRRLLFAAAIVVAATSAGISEAEIEAYLKEIGMIDGEERAPGTADDPEAFRGKIWGPAAAS